MTEELQELEHIKNIAHTVLHRMTLWQFVIKGGFWRRQYDEACGKIAKLNGNT